MHILLVGNRQKAEHIFIDLLLLNCLQLKIVLMPKWGQGAFEGDQKVYYTYHIFEQVVNTK